MKEKFYPGSSDLTVVLSREEIGELEPNDQNMPYFKIKADNRVFHFVFSEQEFEFEVEEHPDSESGERLYIVTVIVGALGYRQLLNQGLAGTRYFQGSKITLRSDYD